MKTTGKTIGILTLRLLVNYGGVLQNVALQIVLRKLGFNAVTLQSPVPMREDARQLERGEGGIKRILLISGLYRLFMSMGGTALLPEGVAKRLGIKSLLLARRGKQIRSFIKRNIKEVTSFYASFSRREIERMGIKACVVGSDQVWRYQYYKDKRFFFCHFLPQELRRRSISYAASFGGDKMDWPDDLISECRKLAGEFKAHSVREDSAVLLCKEYLGVSARWMPDPTFLLTPDEWRRFIMKASDKSESHQSYIAYYILDMTKEKCEYLEKLSQSVKMPLVNCMYDRPFDLKYEMQESQSEFRSVEDWLRIIDSARYMVTDSFHGVVFSLIFNTNFLCVINESRGVSRFDSLSQKLNIGSYVVKESSLSNTHLKTVAAKEWERVNAVISAWRNQGYKYLVENLRDETEV